jgi:hypothetical protein
LAMLMSASQISIKPSNQRLDDEDNLDASVRAH